MMQTRSQTGNVRWRSIALPIEHGGWGFISEPILLGLLLAPSWGGFALSVAAFAIFLLRQPLKIYAKDIRNRRRVPRTVTARRFVLFFGTIALAAGGIMLVFLPAADALLPFLLALPLVTIQLANDVRNRSRTLLAELAGAIAPGAITSVLVLMHGWSYPLAFGLWLALAISGITSVLYVRARLRLERRKPAAIRLTVAIHIGGFIIVSAAAATKVLIGTAPIAMAILLIRAVLGLSPLRKTRPPKVIGMQEMGYGLLFIALIWLGYAVS